MILYWGIWRHSDPGSIVSFWTNLQEEGAGRKRWRSQGYCGGAANSAQCHQQLPILGIKHTGAQELEYNPEVVGRKVVGLPWAWKSAAKSKLLRVVGGGLAFSASTAFFCPAMIGDESVDGGTLSEVKEPGN